MYYGMHIKAELKLLHFLVQGKPEKNLMYLVMQ